MFYLRITRQMISGGNITEYQSQMQISAGFLCNKTFNHARKYTKWDPL